MIGTALMLAAILAAERSPEEKQSMIDLAYVLGEAHALRLACAGPGDQVWRVGMNRMIALEKPDDALKRRLVDSFNTGFMARQAEHTTCSPATAEAERATAARGRDLARRLAGDSP